MRAQGRSPRGAAARPAPAPALEAGGDTGETEAPSPVVRFGSPHSMSESSSLSPRKSPVEVDPFLGMVDMGPVSDLVDFSMLDSDGLFGYPSTGCENMANLFLVRKKSHHSAARGDGQKRR